MATEFVRGKGGKQMLVLWGAPCCLVEEQLFPHVISLALQSIIWAFKSANGLELYHATYLRHLAYESLAQCTSTVYKI